MSSITKSDLYVDFLQITSDNKKARVGDQNEVQDM